MKYPDWKAIYIDKTKTLEEWRAAKEAEYAAQSKNISPSLKASVGGGNASSNLRGLSAGNINWIPKEGSPPRIIERIDFSQEIIQKTLEKYESQICQSPFENAIIITKEGAVWHCSGDEHNIPKKYFDQMQKELEGAHVTHNHPIGALENDNTFSDDDADLFEFFKLARLRGIDEKFVYELNLNAEDNELAGHDLVEVYNLGFDFKDYHVAMMLRALTSGYGYRRWSR